MVIETKAHIFVKHLKSQNGLNHWIGAKVMAFLSRGLKLDGFGLVVDAPYVVNMIKMRLTLLNGGVYQEYVQ